MRTLLAKKTIWVYLAIGMIELLTMFVDNAFGSGPTCPPCANPYFNGSGWVCGGCVIDCGNCYKCNTSTIPPSCEDKCDSLNCKYCPDCSTGCISKCDPDLCQICNGHGGCISRCDSSQCESCKNGHCAICNDDANLKCCNPVWPGVCREKCKLVDGENCTGPDGSCTGCADGGTDCTWGWRPIPKHWKSGTEKKCNPRGCLNDCEENVNKVCYEFVPCIPSSIPIFTMICKDISTGPPIPSVYMCQFGDGPACHWCVEDSDPENIKQHKVHNDTCAE